MEHKHHCGPIKLEDSLYVNVCKDVPSHSQQFAVVSVEALCWSQIGEAWITTLQYERGLKRNKLGAPIIIESRCFPVHLVTWLWTYFGANQSFLKLEGPNIELLNIFVGNGKWHRSGWCYHQSDVGETWMVNGVEITFDTKTRTLKVKFFCDAENANKVSFKVQ